MLSVEQTQNSIIRDLEEYLKVPVVEQGIPDSKTVLRNSANRITPYAAVQFGPVRQEGPRSMIGGWGDDYVLPFQVNCIAGKPSDARHLYNLVLEFMLGRSYEWTGDSRVAVGGPMFTLTTSDGATEAYMFPSSYKTVIQLAII